MLLALALSLALDHPVSPVELGTARGGQWSARAVASDGRDFLAVWNDDRLESPGVRAAVVRDDGPTPSVALGALPFGDAAAAWDGAAYVVAWLESDVYGPTFTRVARLDRDGALLGITEGLLGVKATPPASVAMAVNRGVTVVAWLSDASVAVQRLGRDGRVAAESAIAVRECQHVRLVASGDGFVLLAQRGLTSTEGIVAWRLDGNGVPLGDVVAITDNTLTAGTYGVAAFGPQLVVNSITAPSFGHPARLRTRIVDFDLRGGRNLPDVQVPFGYQNAAITCDAVCTAIVSGGGKYAAAIGSLTASLDPLRGTLGPFEELLTGYADAPRMAWNGRRYLVVWSETQALRAMSCDAFLHAADAPRDVVVEARRQFHVAAAARGNRALLAWTEGFGSTAVDVMTASFDGERMSAPLPLAPDVRNNFTPPAVAATDFGYVVVWMNGGALQSMRVSPSGAPLDAAPRVLAGGSIFRTGVAAAGATVLVVWSDTQHVYGERLGLDAAPFVIADGQNASVASNGREFLVTWTASQAALARRLAPSGKFIDDERIDAGASNGMPVVAASDGRDFLMALAGGASVRVTEFVAGHYELPPTHDLGVIAPGCGFAGAPGRYLLATTTSFWMFGPSSIFELDASGAVRAKTATSWRNVDSAAIVALDGRFLVVTSRADDADPLGVPRRVLWRVVN